MSCFLFSNKEGYSQLRMVMNDKVREDCGNVDI